MTAKAVSAHQNILVVLGQTIGFENFHSAMPHENFQNRFDPTLLGCFEPKQLLPSFPENVFTYKWKETATKAGFRFFIFFFGFETNKSGLTKNCQIVGLKPRSNLIFL